MTTPIFQNPPWHFGTRLANQQLDFLPTDSKEHFEKLCQVDEYREYFKSQGWLEPSAITYKINRHGFRCDNLELDQDCIVTLGCSFTLGIGLPYETVWPNLVGDALQKKVYNLSWAGSSADTCFRMAEYWLSKLKPKAVFVLMPPATRFELLLGSSSQLAQEFMPPNEIPHNYEQYGSYIKHWYSNDENSRLNHKKNKLAIFALCAELNIPCLIYNADEHMARSREEVGYARDRMHAGPVGHRLLAEKMINEYQTRIRHSTS